MTVTGLIRLTTAGVCIVALGALTYGVRTNALQRLDRIVLHSVLSAPAPSLRSCARHISLLGHKLSVGIWACVVALLLIHKRERTRAKQLIIVFCLSGAFTLSLKGWVDRPRPDSPQNATLSPSFPSGHTAMATAVFCASALLVAQLIARDRFRRLFLGMMLFLPIIVGIARLVAGVHYMSDVVAGWCMGILSVAALIDVVPRRPRPAGMP